MMVMFNGDDDFYGDADSYGNDSDADDDNGDDMKIQWNLSVTTISKIKCITFDLFSNVF